MSEASIPRSGGFVEDHFQDVSCLMQASHCFNEAYLAHPAEVFSGSQVMLHVYELVEFVRVNKILASELLPVGGALHAGVEVYGREWSYGGALGSRKTGIVCEVPRSNRKHRYRESISLGFTRLSKAEVALVLGDLVEAWLAEDYHWLHNNCLSFANEFCRKLGVGGIPAWIDRLPRGVSAVNQGVQNLAETVRHLADGTLEVVHAVFQRLKSAPLGVVITVGGLYGHRHGEGEDVLDDPAVELLLEMQQRAVPGLKALCLGCEEEQVTSLTRARSLQKVFQVQALEPESLRSVMPEVSLPKDFTGQVDLLRLDALPHGSSCQMLRSLLQKVHPRLLAMFIFSQIPPPFEFTPHGQNIETPPAIMACSLSAVMQVVAPYNLFLIHLTGPYALFVHRDEWHQELPIDELDCYRKASAWGMEDIPIHFVREWFFHDPDQVLPRLWGNLTSLYADGKGMFTLRV